MGLKDFAKFAPKPDLEAKMEEFLSSGHGTDELYFVDRSNNADGTLIVRVAPTCDTQRVNRQLAMLRQQYGKDEFHGKLFVVSVKENGEPVFADFRQYRVRAMEGAEFNPYPKAETAKADDDLIG